MVDVVRSDIECNVSQSSRVYSTGSGGKEKQLYVDGTRGLVVLHPDMLITPTRITESFSCLRRGVLSERARGLDGGLSGAPAVMGNVKHMFIEVTTATYTLCCG